MRFTTIHLLGTTLALGGALILGGCEGSDDGDDEPNGTTVNVTLSEYVVDLDTSTVPAGEVTFNVTNEGTMLHEFLVVKTDLAEDALPTNADGSYDEEGAGATLIDEVEDVGTGQAAQLTVDLDAGPYVVLCNMVMGTTSHYDLGMHNSLDVE